MKEEEINKSIAEMCGWTECRLVTKVVLSTVREPVAYGIPPNGTYEIACLNYCSDLNAMHEAEAVLKVVDTHEYTNLLYDLACAMQDQTGKWMPYSPTARQRAEAFLRTLGKWEEAE